MESVTGVKAGGSEDALLRVANITARAFWVSICAVDIMTDTSSDDQLREKQLRGLAYSFMYFNVSYNDADTKRGCSRVKSKRIGWFSIKIILNGIPAYPTDLEFALF